MSLKCGISFNVPNLNHKIKHYPGPIFYKKLPYRAYLPLKAGGRHQQIQYPKDGIARFFVIWYIIL